MSTSEDSNINKLSEYEKEIHYYTEVQDFLVICTSILSGQQIGENNFNRSNVKSALKRMQQRHPVLRSHLEFKNEEIFLVYDNENSQIVDQEVELEWLNVSTRENLISHLERVNSERFHYNQKCLLWRCAVHEFVEDSRKKFALTIVIPFSLTDGVNITTLLIEIVNIINASATKTDCDETQNSLQLTENLVTLSKKTGLFTAREAENMKQLKQKYHKFLLAEELSVRKETGLKINLIRLDKETTLNVTRLCKAKQMKVNGFVNAMIVYALRDLYLENNLQFPENLSCGFAANLRLRHQPMLSFKDVRLQVACLNFNINANEFEKCHDLWKVGNYSCKERPKFSNF